MAPADTTKSKGGNSRKESSQLHGERGGQQASVSFCHRYRQRQEMEESRGLRATRSSLPAGFGRGDDDGNTSGGMMINLSSNKQSEATRTRENEDKFELRSSIVVAESICIAKMRDKEEADADEAEAEGEEEKEAVATFTSTKSSPLIEVDSGRAVGPNKQQASSAAACLPCRRQQLARQYNRWPPAALESLISGSRRLIRGKPASATTTTMALQRLLVVCLAITSLAGLALQQVSQSVAGQSFAMPDIGYQTPVPGIARYRSSTGGGGGGGGGQQMTPVAPLAARRPVAGTGAGAGFSQLLAAQAAQNQQSQNQNWPRSLSPASNDFELGQSSAGSSSSDQSLPLVRVGETSNQPPAGRGSTVRTGAGQATNSGNGNNNSKSVRSIVGGSSTISSARQSNSSSASGPSAAAAAAAARTEDVCSDRLCYGLPMGCLGSSASRSAEQQASHSGASSLERQQQQQPQPQPQGSSDERCNVLVTSKRFIDPNRPAARDIHFELIALPKSVAGNYAAVGFSETGKMQGFVSECLQYRDPKTQLQIIRLKHSYNIGGVYTNVPAKILSGVKNLGVSYENGYYQCRWIVESAVEFSYEALNGTIVTRREDLGYKNYHILLAAGDYNHLSDVKNIHTDRVNSIAPVSLAQTGHIKSLGSHILIRIHGSLMIAIWAGFVTLSIILARYYKNEWSNSKINDLAIWFVAHRTLMLASWFGSIIAVIFAYMYTETYHPGLHQISGTTCLILSTVQVLGGLFRPSLESSKRVYFNWTHFICGNLSYLFAMVCLITAAFLAPAHLPPVYIWVIVAFVAIYALTHLMMTIHQYIMHKSSKISITPMSDLNSTSSTSYTSGAFLAGDSYPKEVNSPFRQFMLGTLVTIIVIFIVLLISLVNIR